jgi:hypothetical protein
MRELGASFEAQDEGGWCLSANRQGRKETNRQGRKEENLPVPTFPISERAPTSIILR